MTRESKLKMIGLDKKAYEMRKAGGTWSEITKNINEQHRKEILAEFGEPVSDMGIKRAIIAYEKELINKKFEEGVSPSKEIVRLFSEAVIEANKKIKNLEMKVNMILDDAMKNGTITEKTRVVKELRDTISQIPKNLMALQQYGVQQTNNAADINLTQIKDTNIFLVNITDELINLYDELCDECKKKVDIELIVSKLLDKKHKK